MSLDIIYISIKRNFSIIIDGNQSIDNEVIFSIIDEDLNDLDENKEIYKTKLCTKI